jgi:hypothetical protein
MVLAANEQHSNGALPGALLGGALHEEGRPSLKFRNGPQQANEADGFAMRLFAGSPKRTSNDDRTDVSWVARRKKVGPR